MSRPRPRGSLRRRCEERGAVGVFVAILMALVIPTVSAFVLDIGMQRVGRSDMQSLADVVALDLSRELGARTADQLSAVGQALANASRDRNKSVIGYGSHVPTVTPTWGTVDSSGAFSPSTGSAIPSAVRVTATTTVGFGFGGFTHVFSGDATRSATAISNSGGCFSLGSFALGIESGNSALLTALFNNNLGVSGTVLGYNGLADTDVSLLGLLAVANVGSVSSLANVKASTFFGELASSSVADSATLSLLGSIAASSRLDPTLTVGNMIDLTGAGPDVLDSKVNLLDLVTNSLAVSNGTNFIDAPTGVSVPGLAALKIGLQVIERPRTACGSGEASTGQVRLQVRGTVAGLINLDLGVTLAQAKGHIAAIACSNGAASTMSVQTSSQALVALLAKATILSAAPPDSLPPSVPGSGALYPIPLTDASYDNGVATNSGAVVAPALTLAAVGIDLGPLLNAVLGPALSALTAPLTALLNNTLGITVAGAKIWPMRTPTCALPQLVG